MKPIKITALVIALLMTTPFAFAEIGTAPLGTGGSSGPSGAPTPPPLPPKGKLPPPSPELMKAKEKANRAKMEELRALASTTRQGIRTDIEKMKQNVQIGREGLQREASSTKKEVRDNIEAIRKQGKDMRKEIEGKKQEIRQNFDAKRIANLKKIADNTVKVLEAATVRLDKIVERINSRITKMDAESLDTTKAKEDLVLAQQKIAQAKSQLEALKIEIANIQAWVASASTTPNALGEGNSKIKGLAKTTKESLQAAHQALVKTIEDLEGKGNMGKATTTKEIKDR